MAQRVKFIKPEQVQCGKPVQSTQTKRSEWLVWAAIGLLIGMLCACSPKSSISEINAGIQESVSQLEDYAVNNMDMDSDKQLLLNGAKDCAARADAMEKNCLSQIAERDSKITYWRGVAGVEGLILALLVAWLARIVIKK